MRATEEKGYCTTCKYANPKAYKEAWLRKAGFEYCELIDGWKALHIENPVCKLYKPIKGEENNA